MSEIQPKEKKAPISLDELLAKKEEEKKAANKVCSFRIDIYRHNSH